MEDVGFRIEDLPRIGEERFQLEVLIAADKRVEEQVANALGLSIESDARVEVGRAVLDDHDDGVGVGLL